MSKLSPLKPDEVVRKVRKLEAVVEKVPREIQVIPIDVDSESSTPEFSQCLLC